MLNSFVGASTTDIESQVIDRQIYIFKLKNKRS
jgi:hypothetical protein